MNTHDDIINMIATEAVEEAWLEKHQCRPGMILKGVRLEEHTQPDGVTKYWLATQDIDSLFGSEVSGQCRGFGKTKQAALESLRKDVEKLYESIWI